MAVGSSSRVMTRHIFPGIQDVELGKQAGSRRWVLKCPAHLGFVEDLVDSFPYAHIVWTHRDPPQSLPSLGSMFRTFADMTDADPVDLEVIGREQLAFWSKAVDKCDAALDTGTVRFFSMMIKRSF